MLGPLSPASARVVRFRVHASMQPEDVPCSYGSYFTRAVKQMPYAANPNCGRGGTVDTARSQRAAHSSAGSTPAGDRTIPLSAWAGEPASRCLGNIEPELPALLGPIKGNRIAQPIDRQLHRLSV